MLNIITIDGPSASGKGTIAKKLADRLNYLHLDSGALYRGLAYTCITLSIKPDNIIEIQKVAKDITVTITGNIQLMNGIDTTAYLRTEETGSYLHVSKLTHDQSVRTSIMKIQESFIKNGLGLVVDGRNTWSVFKGAKLHIYLTADLGERAKRRHEQFKKDGFDISYKKVFDDLSLRDTSDKQRPHGTLLQASHMILVDNTNITIDDTVEHILKLWKRTDLK